LELQTLGTFVSYSLICLHLCREYTPCRRQECRHAVS